jgi:hypothetical protein
VENGERADAPRDRAGERVDREKDRRTTASTARERETAERERTGTERDPPTSRGTCDLTEIGRAPLSKYFLFSSLVSLLLSRARAGVLSPSSLFLLSLPVLVCVCVSPPPPRQYGKQKQAPTWKQPKTQREKPARREAEASERRDHTRSLWGSAFSLSLVGQRSVA